MTKATVDEFIELVCATEIQVTLTGMRPRNRADSELRLRKEKPTAETKINLGKLREMFPRVRTHHLETTLASATSFDVAVEVLAETHGKPKQPKQRGDPQQQSRDAGALAGGARTSSDPTDRPATATASPSTAPQLQGAKSLSPQQPSGSTAAPRAHRQKAVRRFQVFRGAEYAQRLLIFFILKRAFIPWFQCVDPE